MSQISNVIEAIKAIETLPEPDEQLSNIVAYCQNIINQRRARAFLRELPECHYLQQEAMLSDTEKAMLPDIIASIQDLVFYNDHSGWETEVNRMCTIGGQRIVAWCSVGNLPDDEGLITTDDEDEVMATFDRDGITVTDLFKKTFGEKASVVKAVVHAIIYRL